MKTVSQSVNPHLIKRLKEIDDLKYDLCKALNIDPETTSLWPIINKKSLTLLTDTPILATQIRFQQKWILSFLKQKHALNITDMNTKLLPPQKASSISGKKPINMGNSTKNTIASIANSINDEDLSKSLMNLIK